MPPLTLDGDTLGEKHRHFNKLVEDAVADDNYELRNISSNDNDVENLLKIDIASKNRNVDYIIEVMKSDDMLYTATAIKKSTWLITEPQYAHIINPEYLHTQLLPSMNTKTFNKLMLHIRLNLKDESRVEAFYEYLKETDSSYKWLQNCSILFIDHVLKNKCQISLSLFKRLCRRSAQFVAYYKQISNREIYDARQEILHCLKTHTADVMNLLEQDTDFYFPKLGKKKTELIMKKCPKIIINNFEKYIYSLDLSVVAKYLDKKKIKSFLYDQAKKSFADHLFFGNNLRYFIKNMIEEDRFEFVKNIFIDKTGRKAFSPECEINFSDPLRKTYQWYEFAPFKVALPKLKNLICTETSCSERSAMLSVLITCTRRNPQNIKTLLKYVHEKHINEPIEFKVQFVDNLLSQISSHVFDDESWNVLDQLFHSIEVYTESKTDVQICLESIILYKVMHDEPVPKIVEEKLKFNHFIKVQSKLNQEQRSKMFAYLLNSALTKFQIENIANESDFGKTIGQLENALILLRDWKNDISKYPSMLQIIQDLIMMRQEKLWKTDMSCLYNVKKSWRKHMFEDSLSLCLSEEACLNALKHKPHLLTRHDQLIDTLRTNDAVSLRRLLTKLRVYWPHSLAQHFTDAYLQHLNKPSGQKAVIKGLFMLLSQNQVIDMAIKYIPDNSKMNWGETHQNEICIRQNIAKNLHVVRPLIPLDTVLWYAKGDYLQHAVPSLNAISSQLNEAESRKYLPELLDTPVSLLKFGLNLAVSKLKPGDLETIFSKIWKTSNLTIRSDLFKHTYYKMCKATNATVQNHLWKLLSTFIENLTAEENTDIYKKIGQIQEIPISIRAEFYMKSYEFLTSLPASANCQDYLRDLIEYAPRVMDALDEDFVVNKMLSPAVTKFCSYGSKYLEIFACYALCGQSEEDQLRRFRLVVEPAIDEAFQLWDITRSDKFYIRDNYDKFLRSLACYFRMYYLAKKILPIQLFLEIKTKMEKELPLIENYVLYTRWKLVTEYAQVMDEHKSVLNEMYDSNTILASQTAYCWVSTDVRNVWRDVHRIISPTLSAVIVKYLKENIEQYNAPTIYSLFNKAFVKMFEEFNFQDDILILETLQHMLHHKDFIPICCVVSKATPKHIFVLIESKMRSRIRKILESHPSIAVRMHYYNDFRLPPAHESDCQ